MRIATAIFCLLIFSGCSSDDPAEESLPRVESYNMAYGEYPVTVLPTTEGDNLVKFEYDSQGRIIRRTGDIISTSPSSGSGGYISDSLYTDLEFTANKVILTKKISYLGMSVPEHKTTITFDPQGRPVQKIILSNITESNRLDTIAYEYSGTRLARFVKTHNYIDPGYPSIRDFEESDIYYSNGNVDSIVTVFSYKADNQANRVMQRRVTKVFSDYDNAKNPFRNLNYFDETFERSISKNNYRECRTFEANYSYTGEYTYELLPAYEIAYKVWSFAYDAEGNWIYSHP